MTTKPVTQIDHAGLFVCFTDADESPLEPGVWLMPAGTVDALAPHTIDADGRPQPDWPADKWPRWNGVAFTLINRPTMPAPAPEPDPVAKLQHFLAANPDVAALLQQGGV